MSEAATLGEALPKEITRVRDEVMPAYAEAGRAGAWALANMRNDLDRASRAMTSGDVVEMLKVYQDLREYHT